MEQPTPSVTITARREGFRRCGIAHSAQPVVYPAEYWSDDELDALRAEPNLIVVDTPANDGEAGIPTTPTIEAALEGALSALREADSGTVREFFQRMAEDPDIQRKLDLEIDRQSALIAAIVELEPGNPEHFNKDGVTPAISALEAKTGLDDVTAAERDAAFAAYQKGMEAS